MIMTRLKLAAVVSMALVVSFGLAWKTARSEDQKTAEGNAATTKSQDEVFAAQRYELIREHVAAAEIRSNEPGFPTQFSNKPFFKYTDPARGYVAAAVWKLGDEGRPKAILTSELVRAENGRSFISHEYTSLTKSPFSVKLDGMNWSPAGTQYEFKPIPDAAQPEATAPRRLLQIRQLAKRFAASEVVDNERCELRLLPQPVDRYSPSRAERADGAIFLLTFGTNPEVLLLIESDGDHWNYAAGRMTGAQEVVLMLDDKIVWQGAPLQKREDAPYTGSVASIVIPGLEADGRKTQK